MAVSFTMGLVALLNHNDIVQQFYESCNTFKKFDAALLNCLVNVFDAICAILFEFQERLSILHKRHDVNFPLHYFKLHLFWLDLIYF